MPRTSKKILYNKTQVQATVKQDDIRIYKTAVYIRLSVEDIRKRESDSIGNQKAILLNYIQKQHDLQLYDIYEDVDYSGSTFNRPAFNQMIEDIKVGLVDCVIVKDLSRFGRNFLETGDYIERIFPSLGIRFISLNDDYDSIKSNTVSSNSGLIVPLKNLMNEICVRDIARKVQSGIRAKQQRGEFCGSLAPYGYIKEGSSLVVDEEAMPVVRQIFTWILDGYSDLKIVQRLNDLKTPPPNRHRFEKDWVRAEKYAKTQFWSKATVKRISENPIYTGVLVQGRHKSDYLNGGGIIKTNCDEWIIVEDTHPAIIDKDTFESVSSIREARKKNYKENKNCVPQENIFKGLIFCGDCKAFMMRTKTSHANGNDEYYFRCSTYEQLNKHACTKKALLESEIKEKLYLTIRKQISFADEVCQSISNMREHKNYHKQQIALNQHINDLQNNLKKNERFRMALYKDLKDNVILDSDHTFMKADYDDEKKRLQQELEILLEEKAQQGNIFSLENKWIKELQRFKSEQQLTPKMVTTLVERIEVYDNTCVEIRLNYRNDFETLLKYIGGTEAKAENG